MKHLWVMEVDGGAEKEKGASVEERIKDLKNILSLCKEPVSQGSLVVINLKKELQEAEEEARQSKPPHVRLQVAMRQRDAGRQGISFQTKRWKKAGRPTNKGSR